MPTFLIEISKRNKLLFPNETVETNTNNSINNFVLKFSKRNNTTNHINYELIFDKIVNISVNDEISEMLLYNDDYSNTILLKAKETYVNRKIFYKQAIFNLNILILDFKYENISTITTYNEPSTSRFLSIFNDILKKENNYVNDVNYLKNIIKYLFTNFIYLQKDFDTLSKKYLSSVDNIKNSTNILKENVNPDTSITKDTSTNNNLKSRSKSFVKENNKEHLNTIRKSVILEKDDPNTKHNIDIKIKEFEEEKGIKLFEKINTGVYKYNNKVLLIFYLNNNIKIRIGGGYINLTDFYDNYIKKESSNKMETFYKSLSPIKNERGVFKFGI